MTTGGDAYTRFHTQIHERRGVSTVHREPNCKGRDPYVITSSHLDCSCRAQPEHAHRRGSCRTSAALHQAPRVDAFSLITRFASRTNAQTNP